MTAFTSEPFTETAVHLVGKGPVSHLRSIDAIEYIGVPEKVYKKYTLLNTMTKPNSTICLKTDKQCLTLTVSKKSVEVIMELVF